MAREGRTRGVALEGTAVPLSVEDVEDLRGIIRFLEPGGVGLAPRNAVALLADRDYWHAKANGALPVGEVTDAEVEAVALVLYADMGVRLSFGAVPEPFRDAVRQMARERLLLARRVNA